MSIPMTPAQAAQNANRDQGGRYATKTHAEADVKLAAAPADESPQEAMYRHLEAAGVRPSVWMHARWTERFGGYERAGAATREQMDEQLHLLDADPALSPWALTEIESAPEVDPLAPRGEYEQQVWDRWGHAWGGEEEQMPSPPDAAFERTPQQMLTVDGLEYACARDEVDAADAQLESALESGRNSVQEHRAVNEAYGRFMSASASLRESSDAVRAQHADPFAADAAVNESLANVRPGGLKVAGVNGAGRVRPDVARDRIFASPMAPLHAERTALLVETLGSLEKLERGSQDSEHDRLMVESSRAWALRMSRTVIASAPDHEAGVESCRRASRLAGTSEWMRGETGDTNAMNDPEFIAQTDALRESIRAASIAGIGVESKPVEEDKVRQHVEALAGGKLSFDGGRTWGLADARGAVGPMVLAWFQDKCGNYVGTDPGTLEPERMIRTR